MLPEALQALCVRVASYQSDARSYAQSIASVRSITGQGKGPMISLHHGFLGCASLLSAR